MAGVSGVEHRVRREVSCGAHHAEQVPAYTELLAVDRGLCRYPDRPVVEHGDGRVKRQWVADALDVDIGEQIDVSPPEGVAAVTTTLIAGNFSTSKKSADRRWLSRLPFPVYSDAAVMSSRPNTAPVSVTWPSPLTSANWPLTVISPHIVLLLNVKLDRAGTRFQPPTT
jgi:hypothetical protein